MLLIAKSVVKVKVSNESKMFSKKFCDASVLPMFF